MKIFEFSNKVVENILQELRRASKYIRIAVFQIHDEDVFALLTEKLKQGVRVEIITLPYDSINLDVQSNVTALFEKLKSNGARLHFCRWNVGDPERTSTAIGRWYSFHG
jgi:PLD-like domain